LNDTPVDPPMTPPKISEAHQVSKVRGIANAGNKVFNDQIVATGIKITNAMIRIAPNKILPIIILQD
jgi:hypothetical protein